MVSPRSLASRALIVHPIAGSGNWRVGRSVASRGANPYLTRMTPTRLLRFLTMIAMLFAPLAMSGSHAAMAMPAPAAMAPMSGHEAAAADHCADMGGASKDLPTADIDCMMACAAMPSALSEVAAYSVAAALPPPLALASGVHGLHPESETPPPRFA